MNVKLKYQIVYFNMFYKSVNSSKTSKYNKYNWVKNMLENWCSLLLDINTLWENGISY